jgi:hypothetical protein
LRRPPAAVSKPAWRLWFRDEASFLDLSSTSGTFSLVEEAARGRLETCVARFWFRDARSSFLNRQNLLNQRSPPYAGCRRPAK